jgi:hypothetical protein
MEDQGGGGGAEERAIVEEFQTRCQEIAESQPDDPLRKLDKLWALIVSYFSSRDNWQEGERARVLSAVLDSGLEFAGLRPVYQLLKAVNGVQGIAAGRPGHLLTFLRLMLNALDAAFAVPAGGTFEVRFTNGPPPSPLYQAVQDLAAGSHVSSIWTICSVCVRPGDSQLQLRLPQNKNLFALKVLRRLLYLLFEREMRGVAERLVRTSAPKWGDAKKLLALLVLPTGAEGGERLADMPLWNRRQLELCLHRARHGGQRVSIRTHPDHVSGLDGRMRTAGTELDPAGLPQSTGKYEACSAFLGMLGFAYVPSWEHSTDLALELELGTVEPCFNTALTADAQVSAQSAFKASHLRAVNSALAAGLGAGAPQATSAVLRVCDPPRPGVALLWLSFPSNGEAARALGELGRLRVAPGGGISEKRVLSAAFAEALVLEDPCLPALELAIQELRTAGAAQDRALRCGQPQAALQVPAPRVGGGAEGGALGPLTADELHALLPRMGTIVMAKVLPEHLDINHPICVLPEGGYVTQAVPGPCVLIAIFNYITLTGELALVVKNPSRPGQRIAVTDLPEALRGDFYLKYSSILERVLGAVRGRLDSTIKRTNMLNFLGALSPQQKYAEDRAAYQRCLDMAELIATAAELPLDAAGQPRVNARGQRQQWSGADAAPMLTGALDGLDSPITKLLAMLDIPFLHGYVPSPGSSAQALLGQLSALQAATLGGLDPGVPDDARALHKALPHIPVGVSITPAQLRECFGEEGFLAQNFPMLVGAGRAQPPATPTGLRTMAASFHGEPGYAVQYSQNQCVIS